MNEHEMFFFLWGIVLPAIIMVGAYVAVRLHERSLERRGED